MTVLLKTSTNSLNLDSTVLQRQMAFCAGSSMEKKQLVTLEAMVKICFRILAAFSAGKSSSALIKFYLSLQLKGTALDATDDVINFFINTSERALFPVYEDYLSTSEGWLIYKSMHSTFNMCIVNEIELKYCNSKVV